MNDVYNHDTINESDIAIIAMSCRFPGADNIETFWQNLHDGVESISFFSDEELLAEGIDPELLKKPNYVKAKGVLSDIESFDASFFGFSPREAAQMDPQHRLFLEEAWKILETSGYNSETYDGLIAVFAGIGINTYLLNNLSTQRKHLESTTGTFPLLIGNDKDYLPTRVSYKLNLKGPSLTVQTACSTSLVATHLACQSLLNGESDMALAGGVSLQVPHKAGYIYQEGMILSPDGHCRAFDARGKGIVYGNGVGLIMLKRLTDAVADGDTIHAVIKGTAINNDGSLKVAYTAPSVDGQAAVIAEAQAVADIDPETVSYIETHGTGTSLGDPIEIAALSQAFREQTEKIGFCAIGSVKTNVGHLDTASGVAGLIKTVLSMQHKMLPPSLHFESPNPKIDFTKTPFFVNNTLTEWKTTGIPRRAGVSSFGFGGTNAHIVLEEAPLSEPSGESRSEQLLLLSARTESALEQAATNLGTYLQEHSAMNLADVAYTLQVGRKPFNHRKILVCKDVEDAIAVLNTPDPKRVFTGVQEEETRPVMFMFPGQGAQYVNMALGLYDEEPLFREQVDQCAELLKPLLGLDLRDILYPAENRAEEAAEQLKQTAITQPAIFVIEYALAKLWMEWGMQPQAVIGHSIGEFAAACIAGVFSLEDALKLVAARGRLMQSLPAGTMLSVPLQEEEVLPLLSEELSVAAVNSPTQSVVSGPTEAIDALENSLKDQGIRCIRLQTSHAFHSPMMEPILKPFAEIVSTITLNAPEIPWVSTVTGTWVTAEEATGKDYWVNNVRQTVRFADGVQNLLQDPAQILLEVGPGRTLSTLASRHPEKSPEQVALSSLRHPKTKQSDLSFLLTSLGKLWLENVHIDWEGFYGDEKRHRIPLPTYPFERKRFWVDPQEQPEVPQVSDEKKPDIADWFYLPSWKRAPLASSAISDISKPSGWAIFSDAYGVGEQLAARLRDEEHTVFTVIPGTTFKKESEQQFTINPSVPEDYDALFDEFRNMENIPGVVIHCWSLSGEASVTPLLERLDEAQDRGLQSVLALTKVLGKQTFDETCQFVVVSNNMQEVTGDDLLYPEKATVLGACKVISQEYPSIRCRSIDVTLPEAGNQQRLIEQLFTELMAATSDSVLAYRGNHRWIRLFEPIKLEHSEKETLKLREQGAYLITGGFGGIGLTLAKHLAERVQARLILTGRSAFPPKAEWEQWLSEHSEQDSTSRKIRHVQELEQLGADVLVACVDVTNQEQMRHVVTQAIEHFGTIHGVIHAAGIPAGGMIQQRTAEAVREVLAPKVRGTLALNAALSGTEPDFFVLCSSVASVLGGFGQVDYCAANAFLDAFACYNTAQNDIPTIAINWDSWQEVGMAVEAVKQLTGSEAIKGEIKKMTHPLFEQRIIESPEQETSISKFIVNKLWVLDEHRVLGKATLPGTAYVEMARAAFKPLAQGNTIELREMNILAPLTVEEDEEKEVRTILKKQDEDFEFVVTTRQSPQDTQWIEHAKGIIRSVDVEPSTPHSLEAIQNACNQQEIVVTGEEQKLHAGFIEYGSRWQNVKHIHEGEKQGLLLLELPEEFVADVQSFVLHPALLDSATGFLAVKNEGTCLPFSYKGLKIKGALSGRIFSYIRYIDTTSNDTLTFAITIMDEQGNELVEIEEYTLRKVDASRFNISAVSRRSSARPVEQPSAPPSEILKKGISNTEGVEVFGRVLANSFSQVIVSTSDLQLRIEQDNPFQDVELPDTLTKASLSKPSHPRPDLSTEYAAPTTETEQALVDIWQAYLGIEQVGIFDDFFELGGDSLMGTQVISRVRETFQVDLPVGGLFEDPTIAALAKQIDAIRWAAQAPSVSEEIPASEDREEGEI